MPNTQPKTEHLKKSQYERLDSGGEALSRSPTSVNLELPVHEALNGRYKGKEKAAWLRRVIRAAVEAEGLL